MRLNTFANVAPSSLSRDGPRCGANRRGRRLAVPGRGRSPFSTDWPQSFRRRPWNASLPFAV